MTNPGMFSWREINTQAQAWRAAIAATLGLKDDLLALVGRSGAQGVFFTGCGSTHCLSQYAAPFFQRVTGVSCRGVPASELWLQTDTLLLAGQKPLIVALSRSGETSETIMAVQKMRQRGCAVIAISCYDQTPLSEGSNLTIHIPDGREESFAQTRSFAGMLTAVQVLAALVADDAGLLDDLRALPALADGLIARAQPLAQAVGANETMRRITYLGSGALYGLANEAMVKVKEMSLSVAEGFHFMEFRHGPMALVDGEHLVVALVSEATRDFELAVLRDCKARGATVVAIADRDEGLSAVCDQVLTLDAPVCEAARGVLYLPALQLLAYYRALGRNLDPDRPRSVVMSVRLQGTEMA